MLSLLPLAQAQVLVPFVAQVWWRLASCISSSAVPLASCAVTRWQPCSPRWGRRAPWLGRFATRYRSCSNKQRAGEPWASPTGRPLLLFPLGICSFPGWLPGPISSRASQDLPKGGHEALFPHFERPHPIPVSPPGFLTCGTKFHSQCCQSGAYPQPVTRLKAIHSLQETLSRQPGGSAETGLCQWEGPGPQPTGLETHMGTHSTY